MKSELNKRYGLLTAIAMVVGIVIGSGVFFKAERILAITGGDLPLGIWAWILGGSIMIICAYTFAVMATRFVYVSGVVDYAEVTVGRGYGYFLGWFLATIYYPSLTSVLAWICARYTAVLIGWDITGGECMTLACFYLICSFTINALSPILAGKFQVTTTIIKLIPLGLMAICGTIAGLSNGMLVQNFTTIVTQVEHSRAYILFSAVVSTAFAYEGWIIAASINAELKDSKKNLPIALVSGTFIIMTVYILYYIGLAGAVPNETMMAGGEAGAHLAFSTIFSQVGGTLIFVFVIISCLGTLNGLMLGCVRGMYAVAIRGQGPCSALFSQVDKVSNMPTNSSIMGLLYCGVWLLFFYGANLGDAWFGFFCFDSSELPIISLYGSYIPIFIQFMRKNKDLSPLKRFVMPTLSVFGCLFMVVAACFSHKIAVIAYLIVFGIVSLLGLMFYYPKHGDNIT